MPDLTKIPMGVVGHDGAESTTLGAQSIQFVMDRWTTAVWVIVGRFDGTVKAPIKNLELFLTEAQRLTREALRMFP